jgi:sacsin
MTVEITKSDDKSAQLQSVKAIYKYLDDTFIKGSISSEQHQQIQERFAHRQCLWDESRGKFWRPKHAFLDDVPFFGNRRTTIAVSHPFSEVYQLLGQGISPVVQDYLDFLEELAAEYSNTPLNAADKNYAIEVIGRLESQQSLEGCTVKNPPILTANITLAPACQVLISDAPWRKDYIDPNRILHQQISPKFAKSAGSLSLLKDVIERPTTVKSALNTKSNDWCLEWQNTLNSPEFRSGLKRLIFHERDSEPILDIVWIAKAKVSPASQIHVDLFWKGETQIASSIPGTQYFDEFNKIFHIISSSSRYIMLCYLAESINARLGECAVQNLLPLASIIDAEPNNINALLNELRIRSLPGDLSPVTAANLEITSPAKESGERKGDRSIYWGAF